MAGHRADGVGLYVSGETHRAAGRHRVLRGRREEDGRREPRQRHRARDRAVAKVSEPGQRPLQDRCLGADRARPVREGQAARASGRCDRFAPRRHLHALAARGSRGMERPQPAGHVQDPRVGAQRPRGGRAGRSQPRLRHRRRLLRRREVRQAQRAERGPRRVRLLAGDPLRARLHPARSPHGVRATLRGPPARWRQRGGLLQGRLREAPSSIPRSLSATTARS